MSTEVPLSCSSQHKACTNQEPLVVLRQE